MSLTEGYLIAHALNPENTADVFARVTADDFQQQDYRAIAQAMAGLLEENRGVDVVTVAERLEGQGYDDPIGMVMPMAEMVGAGSARNIDDYAAIVRSGSLKVRMQHALTSAQHIVANEEPDSALPKIENLFQELDSAPSDDGVWDMGDACRAFYEEMERRVEAGGEILGLTTGFRDLDERLNGLRGGDFVVIAGRPSMGKTTLALNIAEHTSIKQRKPSVVFSMEMDPSQITEKMIASQGGIDLGTLRRGTLDNDQWARFASASTLVSKSPMFIDKRGGLTVSQVRARCHRIKQRHGLDLAVVDYIGLMRGEGSNRNEQLTNISAGLKAMAKDLDIPVVVLSQLNRGVEQRQDKRPAMSDLRESGALEQDADVILFPYRDEYYDPDTPHKGVVELNAAKLRMGEIGVTGLRWEGQFSRFRDLDYKPDFKAMAQGTTRKGQSSYSRGMEV
mgnify:CR=1 FL=1